MFEIGEIVAVNFVYQNVSHIRPCLILNRHNNDYTALFISKDVEKYKQEDSSLIIDSSNLEDGILKHKSIVRTHNPCFVFKELIVNKLHILI